MPEREILRIRGAEWQFWVSYAFGAGELCGSAAQKDLFFVRRTISSNLALRC